MDKTSERLEKIAPWGILGFSVTLFGVIIAILVFYFQENSAKVRAGWWVRNEENLVDVRETISDLRILYNGQDILETGKEIRILTLEFLNDGREITQDMYDRNLEFGLRFSNSEIITGQVLRASSKYIEENLKPLMKSEQNGRSTNAVVSTILIPKLILDRGNAFTLKVYLLQPKKLDSSEIACLGKISGLDAIRINAAQPTRAPGNGVWTATVTALGSCLLGLVIYVIGGVSSRAKAAHRDHILEALRRELQDVSLYQQIENQTDPQGQKALPASSVSGQSLPPPAAPSNAA